MENRASNVIQDEKVREIEFLIEVLKLTDDTSAKALSAQDGRAATESGSTASPQDESGSTVTPQDENGSTVTPQDEGVATRTAKSELDLFKTDLQKIANESNDPTFGNISAKLLSTSTTTEQEGIEIHEEAIAIYLNRVNISIETNENLMRDFKELFDQIVSVLEYIMSIGTCHLSFENRKTVFQNVMYIRQDIRFKIEGFNRVRSYLEGFLQFLHEIKLPIIFPRIESAPVIAERSKTLLIAVKSLLDELLKYEYYASAIIECITKELLTG